MANTYEFPPRVEPNQVPVNGIVQPSVLPPPERPGRDTNQLRFLLQQVVKAVWNRKFSEPFREPVDATTLNLPDYHEKIKRPMDLGTIKKRLENRYYCSSSEAIEDFHIMFTNCYAYNGTSDDVNVTWMAHKLEKVLRKKIAEMPKDEVCIEVDLHKTVTFAPGSTMVAHKSYRKKVTRPKPVLKTKPQNATEKSTEAAASVETVPDISKELPTEEEAQKSKGRRKTTALTKPRQNATKKSIEAPASVETVPDISKELPTEAEAQKSKERRKTIAPTKSRQNATKKSIETVALVEIVPGNSKELPAEAEAQKSKERRKAIAPTKTRQNATKKSIETVASVEIVPDNSKELPTEAEAQKSKGRRKTIALTKPRQNATEISTEAPASVETVPDISKELPTEAEAQVTTEQRKLPDATSSTEIACNENIANSKESSTEQAVAPKILRNEITEKLFERDESIETENILNENIENSTEILSNKIEKEVITEEMSTLEKRPNELQTLGQVDRLNENDLDSISDNGRIRSLETIVNMLCLEVKKLKEEKRLENKRKTGIVYSNAPPSKRARTDTSVYCKEEIVIDSSASETSFISTPSPANVVIPYIQKVLCQLPEELWSVVATIVMQCEPTLEDSVTGQIHLDLFELEPTTVDALKSFIDGLDGCNVE